ncbi:hypothetical protein GW17_00054023 [Ensete ventricosum]|nr:hypothetical protein GW17_00054023 [Ensete ventricosum]
MRGQSLKFPELRACRGLAASDRPLRARNWQPPQRAGRSQPRPRVAAPCGRSPLVNGRQPPCRGALAATGRPCGGVGRGSRPLEGGLGRSRLPLAASHGQPLLLAVLTANTLNDSTRFNLITRRSYIPVLQIRKEKMKEVKRPPL